MHDAVPTTVAAVVTLVPEGLILLTSLTFAVAAMRMARRGALAQQLNAIESLASVDTICLDKTGHADRRAHPASRRSSPPTASTRASSHTRSAASRRARRTRNATLAAIAEHAAGVAEEPRAVGAVLVAAPLERARARRDDVRARRARALPARRAAGDRRRGGARRPPRRRIRHRARARVDEDATPAIGQLLGLVVLGERLRADARETVEFLRSQGVRIAVLSGDRPETVAAVAADAGIEVGEPLDGSDLPRRRRRRSAACSTSTRDRPDRAARTRNASSKRSPRDGRYVAMVGDGVNDVPALKAARLAIAQGSGSQMARAVVRPRARARRLREHARARRRRAQGAAQPPAGGEALRREVGVRDVPRPLDRADAAGRTRCCRAI